MRPAPFDYIAPDSLDGVLEILAERRSEARLLAGGQTLIPLLARRAVQPKIVVDIRLVSTLRGANCADEEYRLGAMATMAQVMSSSALLAAVPGFDRIVQSSGPVAIRSRSTVGGCTVSAIPFGQLITFLSAWNGSAKVRAAGRERLVSVESLTRVGLNPDEIVTDIRIPRWGGARAGFGIAGRAEKVSAVIRNIDGRSVSLAIGGLTRQMQVTDIHTDVYEQLEYLCASTEPPDRYRVDLAHAAVTRAVEHLKELP